MKFIYFKTIILLAVMLAICSPGAVFAEDVELLLNDPDGNGVGSVGTDLIGTWASLIYNTSQNTHTTQYCIIPQTEMEAQGGRPGLVNSIALRLSSPKTLALNPNARIEIHMANIPWTDVLNATGGTNTTTSIITDEKLASVGASYQLVYSMSAFNFMKLHAEHFGNGTEQHYDTTLATPEDEREKWPEFNFIANGKQPFTYNGGGVLVKICLWDTYDGSSGRTLFRIIAEGNSTGLAWKHSKQGTPGNNCINPSASSSTLNSYYRNWLKFGMSLPDLSSKYVSAAVSQATSFEGTRPGAKDIPVLKYSIRALSGEPKTKIDKITFEGKSSVGVITAAKLYYTGTGTQATNSFDPQAATLVATLNYPNSLGNNNTFNFEFAAMDLEEGSNNFWLVYDVFDNTPVGDGLIDAQFVSMHLFDVNHENIDYENQWPVTTPDPNGAINIMSHGYRYAGPVNEATGVPTDVWPLGGERIESYSIERTHAAPPGHNFNAEYLLTQYPPEAFGNTPGYIKRIAFYVFQQLNINGLTDMLDNIYILLRNNGKSDASVPTWTPNIASTLDEQQTGTWAGINMFTAQQFIDMAEEDGFTLVKGPFNWDMNSWPTVPGEVVGQPGRLTGHSTSQFWTEDIVFDEPFVYDGKGIDLIVFKANWHRPPGTTIGASTKIIQFANYSNEAMRSRYGYAHVDPKSADIPDPINSGSQNFLKVPYGTTGNNSPTGNGFRTTAPYLRSYVTYVVGQYYQQPFTFQGQAGTAAGAENANVKGICIEVTGENEAPFIHLKDLTFAGTNNFQLVKNAKLYYSGSDSAFSTNNKIAPDVAINSATDIANLEFDLATPNATNGLNLGMGKHYFWLAFEVAADAPTGAELSAKCTGGTIHRVVPTTGQASVFDISTVIRDANPNSKTTINNKMPGGTYTVGSGLETATHYNTLAKLAQDITLRGVAGDVTINIRESISAQDPAIFGVSPSASHIKFTLQSEPNRGILTINNTDNVAANAGNPTIVLSGATNFTIKNLNIKRENYGSAIRLSGASTIAIENTTIEGANNAIDIYKSKDFVFKNNTFLSGTSFAVNITGGSAQGDISENTFGSATGQLASGISMLDGTNNINVYSNYFHSLTGARDKAEVFNIAGLSDRQPLAINIMNNTVNDTKAQETASVFEIANASDVRIYHNTVLITNAGQATNAQVFHLPTNTNSLTVRNNLFSNTAVPAGSNHYQFWLIADRSQVFATPADGNNNLYNGNAGSTTFGRNLNALQTVFLLLDWQQNSQYELNSYAVAETAFAMADNHIDGTILGERGMLCPVLPSEWEQAGVDMDGERGIDIAAKYSGFTTVGQDEAKIIIKEIASDLTDKTSCSSGMGATSFSMHKEFDKWADNAQRSYKPQYRNYWYNTNGEQLIEQNGFMANENAQDPTLGVPNPAQENTCNLYCLTQIGYFESQSPTTTLAVVISPYIPNIEDVYLCEGDTKFGLSAEVTGTYNGWQWQKKVNGVWQNTIHTGDGYYNLDFEEDFTNATAVEGTYRLVLQPYPNCGDNTPAYYSNEVTVTISKPLDQNYYVPITNSLDVYGQYYGICSNTPNVWIAAGLPFDNSKQDIVAYQWCKVDLTAGTITPISVADNPTAQSDTLKFAFARYKDAGTYMCYVYGPDHCATDNFTYTNYSAIAATLIINPTAEITSLPVPQLACVGSNMTNCFVVDVFEPSEIQGTTTFQWYKDGKIFSRAGTVTTQRSLSFQNIIESDAGEYQLEMRYLDCEGYYTTVLTPAVALTVKDETRILSQTTKVFGVRGGFTSLEVVANTSSKPLANDAVKYQWYRRYSDSRGSVALSENAHFHGTQTPQLTIVNITTNDLTTTENDYYYCEVNDWCLGSKLTTSPIKVTAAPDITINTHPVPVATCEGSDVTLGISATSTDADYQMNYHWFKEGNSTAIDSGSAQLTLEDVTVADAANYYCVVSFIDLSGTKKQTNSAAITVELKPVITNIESTVGLTVDSGEVLRLQVTTANPNGNYVYNWYLNGYLIQNYDSAVYYVEKTTQLDDGSYYCIVRSVNGCGDAQSDTIDIEIELPSGIIDNNDPLFHITEVLPNPVSNEANISFVLPSAGEAILSLLDFTGREIAQLHSGNFASGINQVQVSNKLNNVASGTYFVVLQFGGRKAAMKITINK